MVKITGAKAHSARLKSLSGPEMTKRIGAILFAAGQEIQIEAQLMITQGSVSGRGHVASSPGQPPNQDTGVLGNNIETVQTGPLTVQVSSNAPYAAALEFGTSRMAERPYMRPATARKRAEVIQMVRQGVAAVIKRAGGVRGGE